MRKGTLERKSMFGDTLRFIDGLYSTSVECPPMLGTHLFLFLHESYARSIVEEQKLAEERFEANIQTRWSRPLERLRAYILLNLEIVEWFVDKHRPTSSTHRVLTLLHGRSCEISMQNVKLLESGYPDGAIARWRTLHEIAVTARLIAKYGENTAERYLDYQVVKNYYDAEKYQKYRNSLGFSTIDSKKLKKLKKEKEKIVSKYGSGFDTGSGKGWLENLPVEDNMEQMEREVGLAFLHPFYDLANTRTHAGPKGATWRMSQGVFSGLFDTRFGASNYGFTDPGQLTALSLSHVTAAVVSQHIGPTELIAVDVLDRFAGEIAVKLGEVAEQIETDEIKSWERETEPET